MIGEEQWLLSPPPKYLGVPNTNGTFTPVWCFYRVASLIPQHAHAGWHNYHLFGSGNEMADTGSEQMWGILPGNA